MVSSAGNHDPIIAYAWTDTTTGSDVLQNNDYTTWRIYAVCKDIDGDLPPSGSVVATISSTDNGDGTATVTNFGAGSTDLTDHRGDGVFLTGLLKVSTSILPGDYSFTVTATDATSRVATATVLVTVSSSQSSLRMASEDLAPTLLKSGDANKVFLKLEFLSNGESININGIRVNKLGTIPDSRVTLYAYWDKNRNGVLDFGTDLLLPGSGGGFTSAYRDFIGSPLFTAIEDEPTYVWLVLSVASATEGYSIGVSVQSQASITAVGVSTPIRILPIGNFPMESSVLTIKGVFKLYGYNRHPSRILTGTDDVRMIELRYIATGETVFVHKINLTLLGTIAPDQVTCYLKDEWNNVLTADLPFDLVTRRLLIDAPPGGWKIDKAWSDRQIYVYFNIAGNNGDTVGVRIDTREDTHAITEVSLDDINPQVSAEPIPSSPSIRTLASAGTVSIDRYGSTTLPTRAGTYSYQRRWLFRCYGEQINFMSIKVTLGGTIPYDRVTGMRMRIYSYYPNAPNPPYPPQSYDNTILFQSDRTALFQRAVVTDPLWSVYMDTNFYGYMYVDTYVYLDHGTEGMTVYTGIALATDVVCEGEVTSVAITPTPYGGGDIPTWSYSRVINGQLYAWGTSLIPSPLVDSSQNIPVLKVTFNAEGQRVRINSLPITKLGTVAMNLVTVRIYQDVDNDTYNRLDGDDVELAITQAGNFVANLITFTAFGAGGLWVTPGTDLNVVVAYSLGLGTAGYNLGCQVNAPGIGTSTDTPNWMSAFPNQCLNLVRNPPLAMPSNTVPIMDRGRLNVTMEDLSPLNPVESTPYVWMKLIFWAQGENVDVNRIHLSASNSSGNDPADWTKIQVRIIRDVNNNSVWNPGLDVTKGIAWFNSNGDINFFSFPLFQVRNRVAYNLLVVVIPTPDSGGNFTLEVNGTDDIQSKGQVSTLSVPPSAAFPLRATEREITP
jgi:hypothetical protein